MNEPCCKDCKHWTKKEDLIIGLCSMLRHNFFRNSHRLDMTKDYAKQLGNPIYTVKHFGCVAFEEKQKGPFFASECGDIDSPFERWFVVFNTGEYRTIIGGATAKDEAEKAARLLNEHWLRREDSKST